MYRKKRLLDIPPDVFLYKLSMNVCSRITEHSNTDGIDLRYKHWEGSIMKKHVDITLTEKSFVILVHEPTNDNVNGIFSCATFINDNDTHAVFVLDDRIPCHLTGMISEVFENLIDEYTSKFKEEDKSNGKTE